MSDEETFFNKMGLEVTSGTPNEGDTHMIYGMITNVLSDTEEEFEVEINFSIKAKMHFVSHDKRELIKERSFEPGMFNCKFTIVREPKEVSVDDGVYGYETECSTVIFGRKQTQTI